MSPPTGRPAAPPPGSPPVLLLLIDVEEEFDWDAPFDRGATSSAAVSELGPVLELLSARGVVPVGVMSHPVVAQAASADRLRGFVQDGLLQPGAHLHPWVCPPHDEAVTPEHSFPGNLPRELEAAKLTTLTEAIERAVGEAPRVYQAGRYGVGPHTFDALHRLGYAVDMSCSPGFDYRDHGGPDFSAQGNQPRWLGGDLLELPVTGGFVGFLGSVAPSVFRFATRPPLSFLRLPAVLARTRAAERMRLSPEGHGLQDMMRLTRALRARGTDVFTLSFHSPSLSPGCTSYVRTHTERDDFLARLVGYVEWFLGELGGRASTPLDLYAELQEREPAAVS